MKRLILLVACLCLCCAGCGFVNPEAEKNRVFGIVEKRCALLLEDIAIGNFARSMAIAGIEDVTAEKGPSGDWFVEYSCGGHGFGSATSYWGFYYSADDDMNRIWCAGQPLVPEGNGFLYRQEDGDNRYYTEWIMDHFYYYEADF